MATLKQRLHRKNGTTYDTIHLETNATVVKMSTTDSTTVSSKLTTVDNSINNLGTEMSSLKSSVSSGKAQIASAITDKGVSTSASDSFSQMATNISQIKGGISGVPVYGTDFTYSGNYQVVNDGDDNWRIKFLSSGVFKPLTDMQIDCFLVGAGGGGGYVHDKWGSSGGGGGYTRTITNTILYANTSYSFVIGTGGTGKTNPSDNPNTSVVGGDGGSTSALNITVNGGKGGTSRNGGDGGSGGGGASVGKNGGAGGSNGGNGTSMTGTLGSDGGTGQGTTTREFGETTGDLYAGGGGGGGQTISGTAGSGGGGIGGCWNTMFQATNGTDNTGGGGGGSTCRHKGNDALGTGSDGAYSGVGGSGIVIIRNSR